MTLRPEGVNALANLLEALASPVRLQILHAVRQPRKIGELRVPAARTRKGEREGRVLARTTVAHHVGALEEAGLLKRIPTEGRAADLVVLDHARLFALVDEVRGLAKLRGLRPDTTDGHTMARDDGEEVNMDPPPRLVLAYGRDDRTAFPLHGAPEEGWTIGRSTACDISLDYDPFASSEASCIRAADNGGHTIEDLGSRNGTWVDWTRVRPGEARRLHAGALILVGRSLLAYQPGD